MRFDFTRDEQNDPDLAWVFQMIPAFDDTVTSGYDMDQGRVITTTRTNQGAFGTWQSPIFRIGGDPADVPEGMRYIAGTVGDQSLYRTQWFVQGDPMVPTDQLPTVRVRSSSFDNQQTDELQITSQGDAAYSPTVEGTLYTQFFSQPDTENRFRLNYDVLNFLDSNAAVASIYLDYVTVEYLGVDALIAPTTASLTQDFRGGETNGWTARSAAPALVAPQLFANTDQGLAIRGRDSVTTGTVYEDVIFGFWGNESDARFTTNTLYRVTWTVASDGTDVMEVPTFRLRVNSFNNQFGAYKQVNSWRDQAMVPLNGTPQTYSTWLQAPTAIAGNRWIFSFDYLYVPYPLRPDLSNDDGLLIPDVSQDDPTVTLYLQELMVEEYQLQ